MNIKRALIASSLVYPIYAGIWFLLTLVPYINAVSWGPFLAFYVLFIPVLLLLAKWYFRTETPTALLGLYFGITLSVVLTALDMLFGVPIHFGGGYAEFYLNWYMFMMYVEFLLVCTYAGWEFDATYTEK
ncbi:MAG: hypothetical protein HOE80_00280 [Candidatus Magasanikbacteria bacterium]|jgi:hypothetical protein|nr:hypothetical protein [Candidatus Magasanikbacteria bacterium]MBT4071149.1 hypothetical protein [Candidatus Magasanikbacteria bacterium]